MEGRTDVAVVHRSEVAPIELPGGSWSRVILTAATVGSTAALGLSSFAPGTATAMLCHETEELAYVLGGLGELRLDDQTVSFGPDSALFIPARVWHAVVNTGSEPVTMVFCFPYPDYPPTERRDVDLDERPK